MHSKQIESSADNMNGADGSSRITLSRATVNTIFFLATFALVAQFVSPGRSLDPVFQAKIDYFKKHKDEFDLVFIGSSRIYRCFDCKIFDREMRDRNHLMRSFNFGLPYLRAHEMDVLVQKILAMKPARLKFVVIELMPWDPTVLEKIAKHDRTIDWHTPYETLAAMRTIALIDAPLTKKLEWWSTHASNFCAKYTNHGGGTRMIELASTPSDEYAWRLKKVAQGHGFIALDDEIDPAYKKRREFFLNDYVPIAGRGQVRMYELFVDQVAEIPSENVGRGTLDRFNLSAQLRQQRMIRGQSVEPIYVVPNVRYGTPNLLALKNFGHLDNVMTYNHPRSFPELYDRDNYWDRGHTNRKGAKEFAKAFSLDMADFLDAR